MLHTLYYIYCSWLQNHILCKMGKLHTSLHVRGHLVIFHPNHCSIQLILNSLQYEDKTLKQFMRVINYAHFPPNRFVKVSHFDTILLDLSSYSTMLSTHLQPNPILARIFLSIIMCTLSCNIFPWISFWVGCIFSFFHFHVGEI